MLDFRHKKLLVIAPHPDDEVIGSTGLIKKIKGQGGKVYVQYLCVGDTRDFSAQGTSRMQTRVKEIKKVARFLKLDDYHIAFQGNEHLKLDLVGQKDIMGIIERDSPVSLEKIKPDIVVFPSLYSYNQDHRLAAQAAHAALRPQEKTTKHFVPVVLAYEMPLDGWSLQHQIVPNFYVSLSRQDLKTKTLAMSYYRSQMRPAPNPRSLDAIKALARLRGSQSGSLLAEAFVAYRITSD